MIIFRQRVNADPMLGQIFLNIIFKLLPLLKTNKQTNTHKKFRKFASNLVKKRTNSIYLKGQSIRFGDDWNNVDHVMQPLKNFSIQRA